MLPHAPVAPIGAHELLIFLLQVGLLLALAFLLGRLAIRLGMPAIVGELCAGVLAGPTVLAHVAPDLHRWLLPHDPAQFHLLDAVGQVGVVLLVGVTGVHMDLGLVRRRGVTAVRVSIGGIVVPFAFGVTAGLLLPTSLLPDSADRDAFALFLGVAMGVSAIPVIAKTLTELRLLHRNVGQLTLCAAMVDDIVGWTLLSVVSAMATIGVRGGAIAVSVGGLIAVFALAALARPLVRAGLRAAARSPEGGPTVTLVAAMVLLAAGATQAMNLEAVLGAFVCGIMIGSCGTLDKEKLAPLSTVVMSVLAPLFFATAGLRIDLTALTRPAILLTGVCVLLIAIVGKFAGAYAGGRLSRLSHWESLALGAGMNARGVIEVIIAMVGLRLGVLSPEMYTIIVLVAVVTSLMAGPLLRLTMGRVEHTAEERLRLTSQIGLYLTAIVCSANGVLLSPCMVARRMYMVLSSPNECHLNDAQRSSFQRLNLYLLAKGAISLSPVIEDVPMARSGSMPGGRTSTVPIWLSALLVVVVVPVAAWLVSGDARVAVVGCSLVAAAFVAWAEIRRDRTVADLQVKHDLEEGLRHRLATQEMATVRLAMELLPAAVERLQQGALAEEALRGLAPPPGVGQELGAAHEAVLRSVIDAVEGQEGLHDSAQRAFVNIARRVQAIVHQQAQDLREMEDKHGDNPEFFADLLHLDHGTALIGRLADSVAVLGGARPGRQWRQNVPLFNVLRGAMSRITDYQRVDLHSVAEFAVVGPAVEPLIHALAELLDNATRYSPPQARVHLTAIEVQSGVAVEIEDAGIGLTEEARVRAESALTRASAGLDLDDLGETPRLGLAVVGRLSRANGFTVALRPSAYGGVRAVLTVPKELITVSTAPGGQIARATHLPPPRPKAGLPGGSRMTAAERPKEEFPRGANGLPQRQRRRGASVSAGAPPAGTASAPADPQSEESENAPVQPGMWLADFHDGISGKLSGADAERPQGDASLGKGE